ncbi:major royal jelly protein 1 [Drosophila grimshawi]|uniref:GH21214 n=1 Tax=Drosophila grimshawi TaxID=7222 RepID=B4J755_DROGR|nr:major royal jelly protein 1 [Drosophila grimshawi]EDW01043.1 GH21214 [Drosophila grimshawi]
MKHQVAPLRLRLPLLLIIFGTIVGKVGASLLGNVLREISPTRSVETVKEWQQLEYGFASEQDRQKAEADGNLMEGFGTPIDVQPHYSANGQARVFTTIPRFVSGIPYTLATVSEQLGSNGPLLQPYPNFAWHNNNGDNCDQITSAFRVAITECNQMWVIDSGNVGGVQHCPPQLLQFDLNNDRLLHRFRLPNDTYVSGASLFIAPNVLVRDPRNKCARTMIYVPDVTYHGLVVYDHQANAAWRIENRFMYPDPDHGEHTIAGESFILMDGIFTVNNDKRNLYFHPLASVSEYSVPLNVINRRENWADFVDAMPDQFQLLGSRESQCAASAMDSRNNLYCVTFNPIKLFAWNTNTPYTARNFVSLPANSDELQFVGGMKVVRNSRGQEELWMLSNRFQKIASGTLNSNEVNFRILRRPLDDIQRQNIVA